MRVLAVPEASDLNGNPYVALLYDALRANGVVIDHVSGRRLLSRPDVVHVQWPERLVRTNHARTLVHDAGKLLLLIAAARLRGTILVWTAHNLQPHERHHQRLMDAFMALFVSQVDLVIGLTAGSRAPLVARHPLLRRRPFVVVAHGHYRDAYAGGERDKAASRRRLGLAPAQRTLLALGYVRKYKNLPDLVGAFVSRPEADAQLAVVGRLGSEALGDEIEAARGRDERVHLRLSEATPDEVVSWHAAADVVVLAYDTSSSLNSGAALLALSLDRPVVMPDGPSARELREQVGADWVIPVRGEVPDFLAAALAAPAPEESRPALDHLEWDRLAEQTLAAYELARERRLRRSLRGLRRRALGRTVTAG
jgi:beta-1,4-mannosyltransferase